jgi:hypothetical protein
MRDDAADFYKVVSKPFTRDGQEFYVEVQGREQLVSLRDAKTDRRIAEVVCPESRHGCTIEEINVARSGELFATQRNSGQGEWGYDVFRTFPLHRVAGITEESGYMMEAPIFSEDETRLIGAAGEGFLGLWWGPQDADDCFEAPAVGGPVTIGFIFVHQLRSNEVTRHWLEINLPAGWIPIDPEGDWYGPRELVTDGKEVRFVPSWRVPVKIPFPLPPVIRLPTPHPSGRGLM